MITVLNYLRSAAGDSVTPVVCRILRQQGIHSNSSFEENRGAVQAVLDALGVTTTRAASAPATIASDGVSPPTRDRRCSHCNTTMRAVIIGNYPGYSCANCNHNEPLAAPMGAAAPYPVS